MNEQAKQLLPFLLPSAAVMGLMYTAAWVKFKRVVGDSATYELRAQGLFNGQGIELVDVAPSLPLGLLALLSALFFLIPLVPMLGPSKQRAFVLGGVMLGLLVMAGAFITSNSFVAHLSQENLYQAKWQWVLLLPIIAQIFGSMALRKISLR